MPNQLGHGSRARYLADLDEVEISKQRGAEFDTAADALARRVKAGRPFARRQPTKTSVELVHRGKVPPPPASEIQKDSSDLAAGMSHHQAHKIVGQYGTVGPLPKTLTDRNERMRAYQARYVATGGNKLDSWTRRAHHSDTAKTAALGIGTAAGAASLAVRSKPVVRALRPAIKQVRRLPKLKGVSRETATHVSDITAGGAAVAGGANELYGDYARKRRSNASSTPAGVAGSALRRMRAYTPPGD